MTSIFSQNTQAFSNAVNVINGVVSKTKNIGYDSTKNLTTIAGYVNCETLGVLGQPVALKSDLTSLATTSAMNTALSGKANSSHSHAISDITDLATTLNGKANSSHNHSIDDITDFVKTEADIPVNARITGVTLTKTTSQSSASPNSIDIVMNIEQRVGKTVRFNECENEQIIIQWQYGGGPGVLPSTEQIYYSDADGVYTKSNSEFTVLSSTLSSNTYTCSLQLKSGSSLTFNDVSSPNIDMYWGNLFVYDYYDYTLQNYLIAENVKGDNEIRLAAVESGLTSAETSLAAAQTAIAGKASSSHTHAINDITNLQATLNDKANSSHTHLIDDLWYNSNQSVRSAIEACAPLSHTHAISDVTNLEATLNGKASSSHTHTIGDVLFTFSYSDGVNTYTDSVPLGELMYYNSHQNRIQLNKQLDSNYLIVGSNVKSTNETRLAACETAIAGKASSSHTHAISDITDLSTTLNNCAKLNAANTFTVYQTMPGIQLTNTVADIYFCPSDTSKTDRARIRYDESSSNSGFLEITTGDDGNEPIYVRQASYSNYDPFGTIVRTLTLLDSSGNTSIPGTLSVPAITLNGNDLQTTLNNLYSGNYKVGDESYYGIGRNSSAQTYMDILGPKAPCELHIWVDNTSRWLSLPTPGFLNAIYGVSSRAFYSCYGWNGDIYTGATTDGLFNGTWSRIPRCDTGNSFTGNQSISGSSDYLFQLFPSYTDTWIRPLAIWNGGMGVGQTMIMLIGVANSARNNGWMGFNYQGWKSSENHLTFGLANADHLFLIYPYKAEFNVPLIVNSTITCTSLTQTSDMRLKENVEELNEDDNVIDNVKVYSFTLKNDDEHRKHYGVIAQELQEIAPELVYDDGSANHYLSVNYTELIPHLIKAYKVSKQQIQDLQHKIHVQDKKINELESKIDRLTELLEHLNIA